jgi:hypothetical protein
MIRYQIEQDKNGNYRVRRGDYFAGSLVDLRPGEEIDDGPISLAISIRGRLPFDLSQKQIKTLYISSSEIDLSDPYLPRQFDKLEITYSYLFGNFDRPMDVYHLKLSNIHYVQNIRAFKKFFAKVGTFSCEMGPMSICAYIPLNAIVVNIPPDFTLRQVDEVLKRHPNCRAISVRVANFQGAKQFLMKYRNRLDLKLQAQSFTYPGCGADRSRLAEFGNKLIQTDEEIYHAHRIVHGDKIDSDGAKRIKGSFHRDLGGRIADFLKPKDIM